MNKNNIFAISSSFYLLQWSLNGSWENICKCSPMFDIKMGQFYQFPNGLQTPFVQFSPDLLQTPFMQVILKDRE